MIELTELEDAINRINAARKWYQGIILSKISLVDDDFINEIKSACPYVQSIISGDHDIHVVFHKNADKWS